MKKVIILVLLVALAVVGVAVLFLMPRETPETIRARLIPRELEELFLTFDSDGDRELDWTEAGAFYYWVEEYISYRYDDEHDPEGLGRLEAGAITQAELGDGRQGDDYWQKPMETVAEGYGDCEDMAILYLAFYRYWNVESYLAIVDADGDSVIDHAICIVWFSEEALEELVEDYGITNFYDFEGKKFVIVDSAYSDAFGFIGEICPWTGEPLPNEYIDFSLYDTKTLEDIFWEKWH